MSELKFRVWTGKEMDYVDNLYYFEEQGITKVEDGKAHGFFGECSIMQYTGLKDKNGKEIYEGDIIRWHDVVTSDYTVTFTDGVFCIDEMPDSNFWHHREEISKKWEVIGNIYENKDLLT